jgi:pyruvyltransferase
MAVEVVHWNPRRPVFTGRIARRMPISTHVNNFGDLIGPLVVSRVLVREGIGSSRVAAGRMLSVGSIMRMARNGDTIWGTGVNGKSLDGDRAKRLDVRAVRGPRTRSLLLDRGIECPEVYGDPALLIPHLWSDEELGVGRASRGTLVLPNLHDYRTARRSPSPVMNPRNRSPWNIIRAIAESTLVVGSSLHGVIIAEAFGIPARFIRSAVEPEFKYRDYLEGTGRFDYEFADSIDHALELGGGPRLEWDHTPLMGAFPYDLWS